MKTTETITGIEWHHSRSDNSNRILLEDGRSIDSSYCTYDKGEELPNYSSCPYNVITGVVKE